MRRLPKWFPQASNKGAWISVLLTVVQVAALFKISEMLPSNSYFFLPRTPFHFVDSEWVSMPLFALCMFMLMIVAANIPDSEFPSQRLVMFALVVPSIALLIGWSVSGALSYHETHYDDGDPPQYEPDF